MTISTSNGTKMKVPACRLSILLVTWLANTNWYVWGYFFCCFPRHTCHFPRADVWITYSVLWSHLVFHSTVAAYFRLEFQKSKAKAKTGRVMTTCEACLEKTQFFSRSLTTVCFIYNLLGHKSVASSESLIMNKELRLEEPRLKITHIYLVLNAKKQANENT